MSKFLNVGDTIYLELQLSNGATDKYPRAYVRNTAGAEISGSPVDLVHVSGGLYTNSDLQMPSTDQVTAQFKVFSDSGHTSEDTTFEKVVEAFQLNPVSGGGGGSCADGIVVQGTVFDDNVVGVVPEDPLVAC